MAQLQSTTITGSNASVVLRVQSPASSSLLFVSGSGNVGIGTTAPAGKLDVRAGSGGRILFGSYDANYYAAFEGGDQLNFYNGASATTGYINYNGPGNILLSRNLYVEGNSSGGTTGAVRINSVGNVGIGLTNPGAKLQVSGTVATDSALADVDAYRIIKPNGGVRVTTNSSETGAIKITYPVSYTNTMHRVKLNIYEYTTNESFTIYFGGYNYSPSSEWYNEFAYILNNPGVDRNFTVRFGHDGSRMVVYIGELASGWTYPQIFIEEVELGYSGQSSTWRDGAWSIDFEASAFQNVTRTISNPQATNWARNGSSTYYGFGNVGIGETSPTARLEVKGSGATSATTAFRVENSSATTSMVVLDDGNVGIGTTSPGQKLSVEGGSIQLNANNAAANYYLILNKKSGQDGGVLFNRDNSGDWQLSNNASNGDLIFYSYGTSNEAITFQKATGNIGIGLSNPTLARLQVQGNVSASSFSGSLLGTASFATTAQTATTASYVAAPGATTQVVFNSLGALSASSGFVLSGSNVGIGVTSPSTRLHVDASGQGLIVSNDVGNRRIYFGTGGTGEPDIQATLSNGTARQLSINAAGGNVGIGTTSPGSRLHVNGGFIRVEGSDTDQYFLEGVRTGGATTLRIYDNSSNLYYDSYGSMYFRANQNGGSGGVVGFLGGNVGIGEASPTARLEVKGSGATSATTALRIENANASSSMVVLDDGNVGIGTTSPNAKLQIANPDAGSDGSQFQRWVYTAGNAGVYELHLKQTVTSGVVRYNFSMVNASTAYNDVLVLDRGNVGIGTTSPGTKLDVVGNARMGANTSQQAFAALQVSAGEGAATTYRDIDLHGSWAAGEGHAITANHGTTTSDIVGQIVFQHDSPGSKIKFGRLYDSVNQSTYPMELVSDGASANLTITGKVGIGTTSPGYKLDVRGTIFSSGSFGNRGVEDAYRIKLYDNGGIANDAGIGLDGSAGAEEMWFNSLNGFYWATGTNGEKMRITQAGNVGIGEVTPTARLEVKGSGTTSATTTLRIENSNASASMVVLDDGNVGIGTTAPDSPLEIYRSQARTSMTGTAFGTLHIDGGETSGYISSITLAQYANVPISIIGTKTDTSAGTTMFFGTSNSYVSGVTNTAMVIRYDGNVGIGTTTPGAKLEVNGNIKLSSTAGSTATPSNIWLGNDYSNGATRDKLKIYLFNSGTEQYGFSVGANGDVQYHSNVFHDFYVNNGNVMRINSSGNVGIGTTTPGAKLDVIGNAQATTLSTTSGLGLNVAGYAYLSQTISGVMTFLGHNVRASDSVANTAVVQNASWISSLIKLYYSDGITFHTDSTVYAAGATYPLSTTERLRITPAGNVGIGETSPTARLEVKGSGTTSSTIAFRVEDANASSSMVVLDNANVGIGMSNPTLARLQVQGNVSASSYTGSLFGTASFANNATSASFAISSSRTVSASYALTASFALNGGGGGSTINVSYNGASVGTFSLLNFTGSGVTVTDKGAGTVDIFLPTSGSGGGGGTPGGADGQVQYNNGGSFGGAISMSYDDTNHRVGIGTNSPGHTLTVVGGLSITGSNLNSTSLRFQDSSGVSRNALYVSSSNWLTLGNTNYAGVDLIRSARLSGSLFDVNNSTGSANQVLTSTANGIAWATATGGGSGSVSGSIYTIPYFSSSTLLYSTSNQFEPLFGYTVFNGSTPRSVVDINNTEAYEGLRIRQPYTPTDSNDSNGHQGQIAWDDNYIYVKTVNNGWMRVELTAF